MNPKKKILIIGSSVADVIINVKKLPAPGEDVHILNQRLCIGGCAFNVSDIIRHFRVPHLLFSPAAPESMGILSEKNGKSVGLSLSCLCLVLKTAAAIVLSTRQANGLLLLTTEPNICFRKNGLI